MTATLSRPDSVPPPAALVCYQIERAFHDRLGVSADALRLLPARKIEDYLVIMRVEDEIDRRRQQQDQRAGPSGASGPAPVHATQQAYEAMRAAAAPPPMPPETPGSPPPAGPA